MFPFKKVLPAALVLSVALPARAQLQEQAQDTIENLQDAIEGETHATQRYKAFAKQAEKEGLDEVANLFRAIAQAEDVHRRNHIRVLRGLGAQPPRVEPERVQVGATRENLRGPIEGEKQEESEMYPEFMREAEMENVPDAVRTFGYARNAEREHEQLFREALAELGRNPPRDYYVNNLTGQVVAVDPGERPAASREGGEFIEVE